MQHGWRVFLAKLNNLAFELRGSGRARASRLQKLLDLPDEPVRGWRVEIPGKHLLTL
jgi:hypothetical protein